MVNTIDISIPVLNEEQRLEKGIITTIDFLETTYLKENFLLTIADNGSRDRTEEIGEKLTENFPNVRYLKVGKKGVGLALKKAWETSTADIVGYMDVDLATDIRHILDVYYDLQNSRIDIVNGSRFLDQSQVINRSVLRKLTSRGFNLLLKTLLDVSFSDGMCGFKFIQRKSYDRLSPLLVNNEWFFCAEMLVWAEWENMVIKEIPIKWTDDGISRVKIIELTIKYLKEILRLRRNRKR